MKKVIIMTVGFGGGHKAMGRNLEEIIYSIDPDAIVKTIDVIEDAWPAFNKATVKAYSGSTSSGNGFWFRVYYRLTDAFPQPLAWFGRLMFTKYARKKYAEEQPDLIIATFPFLADVAARARDYHHGTAAVVSTITDAGRVQGIWLSKLADMTLTATADTVPYLVSRGMDKEKVRFIGFPSAKRFYSPSPAISARKRIGLDPKTFTILLTAGGAGLNPNKVLAVACAISKLRMPYQIIMNAGSNEKLKKDFEKIKFPYAKAKIIEGFTDKMQDFLCASDVICCKSGWLTINEALVLQRALILYDAVPGHEEQNVKYVVDNHFGVYEPEPAGVAKHLQRLMSDPEAFRSYRDSMQVAQTDNNPYEELGALFKSYLLKQR